MRAWTITIANVSARTTSGSDRPAAPRGSVSRSPVASAHYRRALDTGAYNSDKPDVRLNKRTMLAVAGLALATGCGGRAADGPPCAAVGGQFFKIAGDDLRDRQGRRGHHRAVHDQLPAMRDSLVHACEDGAWSRGVRDCMTRATTRIALETCQQQLTDPQRAALAAQALGKSPKAP